MRSTSFSLRAPLAGVLLMAALPALAHPDHDLGALGSAAAGMLHPFTGLDHMMAMLAVGWWAARRAGAEAWLSAPIYASLSCLGACFALLGLSVPLMAAQLGAMLALAGLLAAVLLRPESRLLMLPAAAFALLQGQSHAMALPLGANAVAYFGGYFGATLLLQVAGALVAAGRTDRPGRAAGVAMMLGSLYLLGA